MTAMEMQASKDAERNGRLRASDTKAWKPLSSQIWTRALLRSQPTYRQIRHTRTHTHVSSLHHFEMIIIYIYLNYHYGFVIILES